MFSDPGPSVALPDLDEMKNINDTTGHRAPARRRGAQSRRRGNPAKHS